MSSPLTRRLHRVRPNSFKIHGNQRQKFLRVRGYADIREPKRPSRYAAFGLSGMVPVALVGFVVYGVRFHMFDVVFGAFVHCP
jgi:hypothetical protein